MTRYREKMMLYAVALGVFTIFAAVMVVLGGGPIGWVIGVILISGACGAAISELWPVGRGKETGS